MYYSSKCTYCGKTFYTFNNNREQASRDLFNGIKKHLVEYGEDQKEYEMDEYKEKEENEMYSAMSESEHPPSGGYEI